MTSYKLRHCLRLNHLVNDTNANGLICMEFDQFCSMDNMELSAAAQKIRDVPNAGGNSVVSEVLSFELFKKCFDADLLKTEMEVDYYPEGGSITDYMCSMFNQRLGVSVTRAMKYHGDYTAEDAHRLLNKKLNGVVQSSRNTLDKWHKQILHVWTPSRFIAQMVAHVYNTVSMETKSNTVVIITVAATAQEIFSNR